MTLHSPAFDDGALIPPHFTCDGDDVSPQLEWRGAPEGTRAFALVMEDPDAPRGTCVHWTLYDLPGGVQELPEDIAPSRQLPSGGKQGRNDFGHIGYGGPCPPRGGSHRYVVHLFALDAVLNLSAGASRAELERAMRGHVIGQAELTGRYRRGA